MQYLDLTPLQAKNNALSALLAGFSEEYLNRMQEQEERMYIKEVLPDAKISADKSCAII